MATNDNLNTGSCGSFTTPEELPVSDSNNESSKIWDQEMSHDEVFRYREILRNSEPEILSSVPTPERKVKIDPKIKDIVVEFMVYLCHSDIYVQRVFRNFKSELSMFITTRRGLWYRVCFLYACDKINFCSVRPNIVKMISFLNESSVEGFLVPILINSVFKAIIEDLPFQKVATKRNVKRVSFTYVISKLMFLRDFRPTVFDQVLSTSPYSIQVLSFTIQSKVFAEIIENTLLKYLNRQNLVVRREILHQTKFEELRPFFYHVQREGLICIDPSISLGQVTTVAGTSSLMTHLVGWTAQGLSDILPGYQTSNKLCETLDSIKDTMNTATDLMEDVKDTIPPIREFTDSAKTLIPKVEETTNKVNSIFDRLSEILEPILNVVNGIKDFGKNVVDSVRVLWKFLLEYQQIAFPIVLGILIYIVKDHMGKVVAHTFIAAVVIIAFAYYGAKISEELKKMLLSYFGYNTGFQNQNYDDYVSLAAAMYCVSGVDLKHKSQVIQALKAIPPVAKGAEVVMNALLGFFMKMGLLVSAYLGVEPKFANLVDANLGPWLTTTMNYMSRQKAMGLDTTDLGADNLRAHIDQGIDLAAQFELLNKKSISMTISQNVRNLQQIHAELTALRDTGPKERAEPVCILLTGEPGNGKSTVAKILADALVKIDFKGYPELLASYQRNPQKYIHQRSTEKWFESYDPDTKVLIRDEFPATKETTPDDSPFVQLLDEIGVNSKPLPMANAEQKGKLHYNHAYSILTSNATKFDSEMLLNPNAIARRLHIVVNVSSRGVTNHLRGDALDPSGWKFHLMELEGTNSVKYRMTTVEITLIQLVHLAAGIRALRQHVLRENKKISSQFTDKVCEITDNKLYHIVAKSFKMMHGRMPDNTEFMSMLKELGDDLKELTPNPKTAEAILKDIKDHPYHNQVDIDDDQLIVGEHEVTHSSRPIVTEPSDTVPNVRLEDYVEALRDQAGTTRSRSPPPSYTNNDRPGTPIDDDLNRPIPFHGVTIDLLMYRLQVLYGRILEAAGTPVEFSLAHQFEYNDPSKKDFHEIKIGSKLVCGLSFNTPFGYLQQRIEYMIALAMTYGKVKIFDMPMPWFQAEVTVFTASKTSEGDVITSTSITDKSNVMARMLSTFLHTIGIKRIFSYNVDVLTTNYYNDVWLAYPRLKKLIPVIKDCFVKWTKNEMTTAEARRKIWHTVYPMIPVSFVAACEELKDVVIQQTNKLYVALKGAVKWVKEHWKELLSCLGVVSTIVGMFYMHNGAEEEPDSFLDVFHSQDSSMRADKYVARTRNQNQKRNQVIFKTGEFRSQADIHYIENYSNTLVENMWYFKSRTEKNAGVVLFIERKRAILPGHFYKCALDWYNDDPSQPFMVLEKGSQRFEFSRDEVHVVADFMKDDVDLVILDFLKPQFPFQRNIKNYFVSPKDEGVSLNKSVFRMDLFTPKRIVTDDGVNVEHMIVESSDAHLATEIIVDNSRRRNVISYPIPTLKGECGSVVVHNGKIIGIHIAGNNTWGAAARINSLVLEGSYLLPEVETAEDSSLFTKFEYDKTGLSHSQLYDELVHKGYWSAYCIPGMNPHVRDQLVEWNPKDELKPTVFPADTSVSNYPVAKSKFGPVPKNVDMAIWNACVDAYGNHIMSTVKPSTYKEVLSVEEAFAGVSNTSIRGLDHQTSPGWPYNYLKIDRRRIAYVDESGKLVKGDMYADFVKDMQFQVRMCCHDYTPSWVFTETLKSETRAPEKVKSPRLIAGAPLSHTVISKMHFGAFYAHLADNHYLLPTLIGFDPHQDWDYYQRRMNSFSEGIRESYGDFKGFDCAREVFEMEFVARLANRFYGDDDDSPVGRVRHQLIKGSIVCLHLFHKIFVLEDVGWSSGSYHTAAGNSLFNDLLHMYCAAMEAKEKGMDYVSVINKYFDNVYLKTLGDDCAMGVTKEFSFHNNASMAPILLRDFGMIYTDVKKSPNVKPWDDIEDRLLLKRSASYIVDDGKFYGKLELSTILNTVCYTRIGNEIPVMRQRVDNAIRELSFHPKETWDKYLPIILKKAGPLYVWKNYSWKQLRHMALNDWFNQVSEPTSEVVKLIVQDLADNKRVHWGDLQVLPFTSSSRVIDLTEPSGCNTLDGVSENIKA